MIQNNYFYPEIQLQSRARAILRRERCYRTWLHEIELENYGLGYWANLIDFSLPSIDLNLRQALRSKYSLILI